MTSTHSERSPLDADQAWAALRFRAGRGGAASERIEWRADGGFVDGSAEADASALLDALGPVAGCGGPLILGQLGQTLDGRIATPTGHSHTINGHDALVHLHRLRALVDAVLVGVSTVNADRPRLTVRHVPGRHPVRVVLDPRGRADVAVSPLADDGPEAPPTLHLVGPGVNPAPAGRHVERAVVESDDGRVHPSAVIAALAERGLHRVVEGGAFTLSRFIDACALDRLHLLVAPLLMGSGRCGLDLAPIETVDQAVSVPVRRLVLGDDTLFDLELRPPGSGDR